MTFRHLALGIWPLVGGCGGREIFIPPVILSGVSVSRSEVLTESKDPYRLVAP
jgi:hypothetical protein